MRKWILIFSAIVGLVSSTILLAGTFGTGCQQAYQNGWQTKLTYAWNNCSGFNNQLDNTDSKIYYYNLNNAKYWWEEPNFYNHNLDSVDIFYGMTHGGATSTSSIWAAWNQGQFIYSSSMRLGDNKRQLSIFSTYACNTLKFNDGRMWTRMGPVFRGGLRIATGSHSTLYDSITTDEVGRDYARYLQNGQAVRYAWANGVSDWATAQDATVMATGTSSSNCFSRLGGMKRSNYMNYTRLRDNNIAYYCYTYWNNL